MAFGLLLMLWGSQFDSVLGRKNCLNLTCKRWCFSLKMLWVWSPRKSYVFKKLWENRFAPEHVLAFALAQYVQTQIIYLSCVYYVQMLELLMLFNSQILNAPVFKFVLFWVEQFCVFERKSLLRNLSGHKSFYLDSVAWSQGLMRQTTVGMIQN